VCRWGDWRQRAVKNPGVAVGLFRGAGCSGGVPTGVGSVARTPALGDGDAAISALSNSPSGAKGRRSGTTTDGMAALTTMAASQKPRDKPRARPGVIRSTSCRRLAWG